MNYRIILPLFVAILAGGCGGHPRTPDPAIDLVDDGTHTFQAVRPGVDGYVLSVGDQFDVDFLFERGLNSRVRVRPDGAVALPIVGDIRAAGRTPTQLDSLLTGAYAEFYREPEITINVTSFAPPKVYVLGEVRTQREVELTPGMSAIQALALAGGPLPSANLDSVVLLRRAGDNTAYAQRVNLDDFLKGKGNAWDLLLAPYDILYVPVSFVARMERFVESFFGGLTPIPILYLRGWEVFHTEEVYDTVISRAVVEPADEAPGTGP